MSSSEETAAGWASRVVTLGDTGGVTVPMDHPLVKALEKSVREKQRARERDERRRYVDPRDINFVVGVRA